MVPSIRLAALALAATAAFVWMPEAVAQTLYKLIDKNGKVTYSEKPPKDFDGKVVPLNIDPNANTATLPKPTARPETESEKVLRQPAGASGDKAQAARDRLDAAKKALQDAIDNPKEGEVERIGKKGGGTRPVQSEEYQKRIAALEANVRRAEEELRVAQGR
jgi:hypothetical protein